MTEPEEVVIDSLGEWSRTHDCGSLRKDDEGSHVILMGWVNSRRDLGNLIFVDLRDREGMTQIVFDPHVDKESQNRARILRDEWVIAVKGEVSLRLEGQENPDLPTGDIELKITDLKILNRTSTPPFQVDGAVDASETLRLKHRYLELRRPRVFENFRKRHRIAASIRRYLDSKGFLEVETPFLTRSTPEGARDFLVPSRINKGMFYALPQSPQLFKQLLMVSGFDRYYQIVRCFRDEDLRADRQPEFTQVDLEMAFTEEQGVMDVFEGIMQAVFEDVLGYHVTTPVPRLKYYEAMERFGTDKPDLRFGMELRDISDVASWSDFRVFTSAVADGGVVKGINVRRQAESFSRKELDALEDLIAPCGAKGLAWIKVTDQGWRSPLDKFFNEEHKLALNQRLGAHPGDLVLIVADKPGIVNEALGMLRLNMAERVGIDKRDDFSFVWITDFPLLEYNESDGTVEPMHHPFTAPVDDDLPLLHERPHEVRAKSYDLVLNGTEIGGGSVRNHRLDIQHQVFKALGISLQQAESKFGFFLEALEYGAPPHAGMALGFDRMVAIMAGLNTIREVIAFPKTTSGTCVLTGAPAPVDQEQLHELGLTKKIS